MILLVETWNFAIMVVWSKYTLFVILILADNDGQEPGQIDGPIEIQHTANADDLPIQILNAHVKPTVLGVQRKL